jgi:hypothetical protein
MASVDRMTSVDSEEKIMADLTAIVRRAVALGRRHERDAVRDRLMVAIEGGQREEKVAAPAVNGSGTTATLANGKRPYGSIRRTVAQAILDAGHGGITKKAIRMYCSNKFHVDLSESSIQTALSAFSKHELARYIQKRNRWTMTAKLADQIAQEEPENADAPEHQTQEHRAD